MFNYSERIDENSLEFRTDRLYRKLDKLTKRAFATASASIFDVEGVDEDTIKMVKDCFDLLNESKELMIEESKILDQIPETNKKLDKLIEMSERNYKAQTKKE